MGIGLKILHTLYIKLGRSFRRHFERLLPYSEMLVDRWKKAAELGWGEDSSVYDNSYVYGDVHVGEHSWVGPLTILDGSGAPIRIGEYCSISAGVQIYTHDTVAWALSGGEEPHAKGGSVIIDDYCYIGPGAIICRGVTIGHRCIIGANAVVLDSIPPGSRAYGVPATVREETGGHNARHQSSRHHRAFGRGARTSLYSEWPGRGKL